MFIVEAASGRVLEQAPVPPAAALMACTIGAAFLLVVGNTAGAAIVPTVPLATSANYAVLGASTVTNTGASTLDGSLGLWPGTSITGFPPGQVLPPGTTDTTNAAAKQAQSDLTAAYVNAAGRPLNATTTADLANLTLQAGVYAGPSKGALSLTGPLILDGAGDPSSVFIFQTDSTLITASGSTVTLINGAQECNVFWQVGSSATLGTGSVFAGNILALTSITVTNSVTVHGRALARNGAVTLDNDTFTKPTCVQPAPPPRPPRSRPPPPRLRRRHPTTTTPPPPPSRPRPPPARHHHPAGDDHHHPARDHRDHSARDHRDHSARDHRDHSARDHHHPAGDHGRHGGINQPVGTDRRHAHHRGLDQHVRSRGRHDRHRGIDQPSDRGRTTATAASTSPSAIVLSAVSNKDAAAELAMPLPRTGAPIGSTLLLAAFFLTLGGLAIRFGRSKTAPRR